MRPGVVLGAVVMLVFAATPLWPSVASAAAEEENFLVGDSEPVGSMSSQTPPDTALPNFDPDRDSEPGLVLRPTSGGSSEGDPTRYQQWGRDMSGRTVSVSHFRIWAAPKGFDGTKTVKFAAYLMDCDASCVMIDSASATVSNGTKWRQVSLPLQVSNRTFAEGHSLVVKVAVLADSEEDVWFAYGTDSYDASVHVVYLEQPTTTSAPTTTTTTDTAATEPTTTTVPQQQTPTTVVTQTTTTTNLAVSAGGDPPDDSLLGFEPAKRVVVFGREGSAEVDIFDSVRELEPQEGLMVVFSTVAESITLYWRAALALGCLMAVLMWIGLSRSDFEEVVTDPE